MIINIRLDMAIKTYTYARNKWFAGSLKEMPKKVYMIST